MTQTTTTANELLTWLAGPGAGVVGSMLFAQLRVWFPVPNVRTWRAAMPLQRWLWTLLHAPAWAQWTAPGLATILGIAAVAGLTALQGGDVLQVFDIVLSGLVAGAFALLTHASRTRSRRVEVPDDE